MKTTIFLLAISLFSITSICLSQEKIQNKTCSNIKNGTFSTQHGLLGFLKATYIIQREDNTQVEVDSYGDKYIFDVNWISDCAYNLTLREIVDNPRHTEFSDKPILVEVIEITDRGYKNKITMDIEGSTVVRTTTMVKENPNKYKHLQTYVAN